MFGKYDKEGNIVCQECGKPIKRINDLHLKSHKMTMKEYIEKYKGFPISRVNLGTIEKEDDVTIIVRGPDGSQRWLTSTVKDFFTGKIKELVEEVFKNENKNKSERDSKTIIDRGIEINMNSFVKYEKKLYDTKDMIISFLKVRFRDLESDYIIEDKTIDGFCIFKYVVDMAIVSRKVAIDFPDIFWHNPQITSNIWKKKKDLKSLGWRFLEIKGKADDKNKICETIKNYLKLS
jgi:hypothetical protein